MLALDQYMTAVFVTATRYISTLAVEQVAFRLFWVL